MHSQDIESRIQQQLIMIENSISRPMDLLNKSQVDVHDCGLCEREFNSRAALQAHMECHLNNDPEAPYRCDDCGKSFSVPARLTRHYRTHTGEKPHACTICHKSFSVKENLSVHQRIHTQERPYSCPVCERSFEHSGKLHRHMRIHTGERPHQCNLCNKTFIQSGQLVIHMRTHTGEKPYVCMACSKGFTCSKQLKVHMRTHTGEKPYSCDICGKSFGYNHVLKLHQVAHFGEKVYKCTICKTTFNNKKHLENHIKSHDETLREAANYSPVRPSSVGSSYSEASSNSDKENSTFCRYFIQPMDRSFPPPAHISSLSSPGQLQIPQNPMDAQFILPSINSICPGEVSTLSTLHLRPTSQLLSPTFINTPPSRQPQSSRVPVLFPVTDSLMKNLIAEDLATYGPTASLPKCPETLNTSPPSPISPPSPTSISTMTESSLPLRKRRLALSECSTDEPMVKLAVSPARSSVIMFAARS